MPAPVVQAALITSTAAILAALIGLLAVIVREIVRDLLERQRAKEKND